MNAREHLTRLYFHLFNRLTHTPAADETEYQLGLPVSDPSHQYHVWQGYYTYRERQQAGAAEELQALLQKECERLRGLRNRAQIPVLSNDQIELVVMRGLTYKWELFSHRL
jgi:hypothetical protein